ncbi:hypothetical protein EW026_g295 [Hermanssonia centrifuga]|uniref:F-box domain-containing protein n=1 Tax=Hermanssonia centrifuga TaxID=98765 RepID=A0A4S4KUW5_9APHY|nr:hypothetical protein EW026_g295 [Hermanssonia centrifuga]
MSRIHIYIYEYQGYARSAKLFRKANKLNSALKMVDMALKRVKQSDAKRCQELEALRAEIELAGEKQLQDRRRTFYHFGKLPLELATTIFGLIVESDHASVIRLARVSREWRAVVLETPFLWSTLSLSSRHPVAKAKTWKQRCGGLLKRLHVRSGDMTTIWGVQELRTTPLSFLRALSLTEVRMDHFFNILPTCTPLVIQNLEYLELDSLIAQKDIYKLCAGEHMRLQTLIAKDTPLDWPALANNCSKIRTLTFRAWFDETNLPDFIWLLHRNKQMETLEICFLERLPMHLPLLCPSIPRDLPARIDMPHLTRLSFTGGSGLSSIMFLPYLTLRHVQSLQFSKIRVPLDAYLRRLQEDGAITSLKEFKMNHCMLADPAVLVKLLHDATQMETLELECYSDAGHIAEALAEGTRVPCSESQDPSRPSTVLCPRLTRISFAHSLDLREGPLIRLVKLRNILPINPTVDAVSPVPQASADGISKVVSLVIDGCARVEGGTVSWLRGHVPDLSCRFDVKKEVRRRNW